MVGHRVGQPLEHDDAAPFAAHHAVGLRVERLAAAIRREDLHPGQRHIPQRRQHQVHAAGHSHGTLAGPQALAREVDGDQRRRARRVHDEVRSLKVEHVGKPARRDVVGCARAGKRVHLAQIVELQPEIIGALALEPDEHPRLAAGEIFQRPARILERLPDDFEEETLLRIHPHGLPRGDAEEVRVELIDLVEKAAPPCRDFSGFRRVRVEQLIHVPAVARYLGDGIDTVHQQLPERVGPIGLRKPAGHADNRNRFRRKDARLLRRRLQALCQHRALLGRELCDPFGQVRHVRCRLLPIPPTTGGRRLQTVLRSR